MKEYKTPQRVLLTEFFKQNSDKLFTIDEILAAMPENAHISRSAVYRNVDRMVQDGVLSKSTSPASRKTLYQCIHGSECCERLHLRCEKCGRVFHMESEQDEKQLKHMLSCEGFQLDEGATVLMGTCRACKRGAENT